MQSLITTRGRWAIPALALAFAALVFLLGRCSVPRQPGPGNAAHVHAENSTEAVGFWVCPMGDIPPQPKAGSCPVCGMELVPLPPGEGAGGEPRLTLSAAEQERAGIVLAPAEYRFVTADIRLFGQIEYDPVFYLYVDAFANGIIDRVYVRRPGEYVHQDEKLFDFYSSEIYDLQIEMLDVARKLPNLPGLAQVPAPPMTDQTHPSEYGNTGRPGTEKRQPPAQRQGDPGTLPKPSLSQEELAYYQRRFASLRFRLRSYGLYDQDIMLTLTQQQPAGLINVRVPVMQSRVGGILLEINAVQGQYVNKGTRLFTIADPHFVWARFRAFENDYPWLRVPQEVEFTTPARPGESFTGRITMLEPQFDEKTRTFSVGVVYNDEQNLLRPNMLVEGHVKAKLTRDGKIASEMAPQADAPLVIPATAPLVTGDRAVVYVADNATAPGAPATFTAREVVLGPRSGEWWVVLGGLAEGEQVVASGAFKLDSELQIKARPSMLHPEDLVRMNMPPSRTQTSPRRQ